MIKRYSKSMKKRDILVIAPQPFFIERGTPIAIDLLVRNLDNFGYSIDILAMPIGVSPNYDGINIHRSLNYLKAKELKPGFTLKKIILEVGVIIKFITLMSKCNYRVVHAVEESIFWALLFRPVYKYLLVYDMDSSLVEQMINRFSWLKSIESHLESIENYVCRNSDAVIAVCNSLADKAAKGGSKNIHLLTDVANLQEQTNIECKEDLNEISQNNKIALYVGNLETYQGVTLLYEAARLLQQDKVEICIIIIGGSESDVQYYQNKVNGDGLNNLKFLGSRPVGMLEHYLMQADILLSPRIEGSNTPMKVFNYMASAKPIIATNLNTHSQILNNERALLVPPTSVCFVNGIKKIIENDDYAQRLGSAAKEYVFREHGIDQFRRRLQIAYDTLK